MKHNMGVIKVKKALKIIQILEEVNEFYLQIQKEKDAKLNRKEDSNLKNGMMGYGGGRQESLTNAVKCCSTE